MSKIIIQRQEWPGDLDATTDYEDYLFAAVDPLEAVWTWDDVTCRAACIEAFNVDQLALWAIWNIDGQIENGGFIQSLWNSFGELCEEAVSGFHHFDLHRYASLLDEAFSIFQRPIPIVRMDRQHMLERVLKVQVISGDPDNSAVRKQDSALFKVGSARVSDIEERYFSLKKEEDTLELLVRIFHQRKENFFNL